MNSEEVAYATNLLGNAIADKNPENIRVAVAFTLGVFFASDKFTPIEDRKRALAALQKLTVVNEAELASFALIVNEMLKDFNK